MFSRPYRVNASFRITADYHCMLRVLACVTQQHDLRLVVLAGVVNPGFLHAGNMADMLAACAPFVIIACGVALVVTVWAIRRSKRIESQGY